jgi:PAS domain S-box-containing protein
MLMLSRWQRARQWAVPDPALPLDQQFFQGLCLLAGLLSIFVILPINNYPELSPWVNRGIFGFGLLALAIAWAARRGHFLKKTMLLALVALLDLIWFPNGGSQGSIGLYFFAVALYLVLFYRGSTRHLGLLLLVANIVALHVAELAWPHLAVAFTSQTNRFLDLATGYLISLYVCALMLGVVLWGYNRNRTQLDQTIAALHANEERIQAIFRFLPVVLVIIRRADGRITAVNDTFEQRLGYSAAETIGRVAGNMGIWVDPEERARLLGRLKNGETINDHETRFQTRDGQVLRVSFSAETIAIGGAAHLLCCAVDITERKRMEQELMDLESRQRLLQKAESLSLMAGSIAHLFNNKLQAVVANLELLGDGGDPANKRHIQLAKQATEKASEVSRQMLCYLGQVPGDREPRLLAELCRNALPALRHGLPGAVDLFLEAPPPGPVVQVNVEMLLQALASLVTNAWEAMAEGRGSIRLTVGVCPPEQIPDRHRFPVGWQPTDPDYAVLAVADSGCGIAPEHLERLFDPFFSSKFIGRGLGLSVVLGIIQAHGGALTVTSAVGAGSTFKVFLPLAGEAIPTAPEAEAPAPAAGTTILLVDDDEALLESGKELLEALGYPAITGRDGIEALELFQRHRTEIRCVITDLTMPRMNGWETLAALRRLDPKLPVILASGYDRAKVMAGAQADLPQAFLEKPFTLQQLLDALAKALA